MQSKLVLVIDDNADDRSIYGDLLWYNGFDVMFAETAERGYWLAREGRPDLLVLDLGLPDEDGLQLCKRLRAEAETADLPVVVLSARPEAEFAAEASRSGCSLYMEKPTQPIRLLREVERLIGPAPGGGAPWPARQRRPLTGGGAKPERPLERRTGAPPPIAIVGPQEPDAPGSVKFGPAAPPEAPASVPIATVRRPAPEAPRGTPDEPLPS